MHGWRHRGGAHMCVEGVGAAVVIGLDSCDSPSALSVPRAPSSHRAALESAPRCSELYASKDPDGQAADDRILVGVSRTTRPADAIASEMVSRTTTAGAHSVHRLRGRSRTVQPKFSPAVHPLRLGTRGWGGPGAAQDCL